MITAYVVDVSDDGEGNVMYGDGRKAYLYTDEMAAKVVAEKLKERGHSAVAKPVALFPVEYDYGD